MVAARARGMYDDAAKQRKKRKPTDSVPVNLPEQNKDARDAAGKALGVSGKNIDFASKVLSRNWSRRLTTVGQVGRMRGSKPSVRSVAPTDCGKNVKSLVEK